MQGNFTTRYLHRTQIFRLRGLFSRKENRSNKTPTDFFEGWRQRGKAKRDQGSMQAHNGVDRLSIETFGLKIGRDVFEMKLNFLQKIKFSKASQKSFKKKSHAFHQTRIPIKTPSKAFTSQSSNRKKNFRSGNKAPDEPKKICFVKKTSNKSVESTWKYPVEISISKKLEHGSIVIDSTDFVIQDKKKRNVEKIYQIKASFEPKACQDIKM